MPAEPSTAPLPIARTDFHTEDQEQVSDFLHRTYAGTGCGCAAPTRTAPPASRRPRPPRRS